MKPIRLACRTASYAPFEALAFEHLASLGVRNVEIPVPAPGDLDTVARELARHELTATSLHGDCEIRAEDYEQRVAGQMATFDDLGCRIFFASVKAEALALPVAYNRLRKVGDLVAKHGVTLVLETHPDLITNADVALATMAGVNHPAVRINFDTANLYFYNEGIDPVAELRRVLPYVAAVHLKDTNGGYRTWHFPALGRGVVPFAALFAVLDEANFAGPCTLEIEGLDREQRTQRLVCDRIAESVGYLRGLGRL